MQTPQGSDHTNLGSELKDDFRLNGGTASAAMITTTHTWREAHGGQTPMLEFGNGFIQFAGASRPPSFHQSYRVRS